MELLVAICETAIMEFLNTVLTQYIVSKCTLFVSVNLLVLQVTKVHGLMFCYQNTPSCNYCDNGSYTARLDKGRKRFHQILLATFAKPLISFLPLEKLESFFYH